MPLTIPIKPQQADRINALIRDRNQIQTEAQEQSKASQRRFDEKNEVITGLIEGHIVASGNDPETKRGNVHIELVEGKPALVIDDAPGPRSTVDLASPPAEPIDLKKPATSKKG